MSMKLAWTTLPCDAMCDYAGTIGNTVKQLIIKDWNMSGDDDDGARFPQKYFLIL